MEVHFPCRHGKSGYGVHCIYLYRYGSNAGPQYSPVANTSREKCDHSVAAQERPAQAEAAESRSHRGPREEIRGCLQLRVISHNFPHL
jgi:hypothetical protein